MQPNPANKPRADAFASNSGSHAVNGSDGHTTALVVILVFAVGVVSRLPAVGTWWCLDDWGQLARAAGVIENAPGWPARILSQQIWWSLTWPLFHTSVIGHAVARISLHALAAIAVVRLARAFELPTVAQLFAGCLFAAGPVSCTPTYWASGIQELLGVTCALWACERWTAPGRFAPLAAALLGVCSILSKECALALPLAFGVTIALGLPTCTDRRRIRWSIVAALAALTFFEAGLVLRHFATGIRDPYAIGGPMVVLGNLGKFGWWLLNPGFSFTGQVTWTLACLGMAAIAAWVVIGAISWKRCNRVPLFALCCWLVTVIPALPLVNQARPYMGYLGTAPFAIALASLWPVRRSPTSAALVLGAILAACWGSATMWTWTKQSEEATDPVVASAMSARNTAEELRTAIAGAGYDPGKDLVIYQPTPMRAPPGGTGDMASGPIQTPRYRAMSGPLGASLMIGSTRPVIWTTTLVSIPEGAYVICEKSSGFQSWGSARDALLYAAEICVAAGDYIQATSCLRKALAIAPHAGMTLPPANKVGMPDAGMQEARRRFDGWLIDAAISKMISGDEYLAFRGFPSLS